MMPSERRWCWLFSAALVALTTLPYVMGFAAQGSGWRFTGFVLGVEDGNSYLAKMLSGSYGDWVFRSPYSTFPQRGTLAFLPYLVLGKLAAGEALSEQLAVLYHLFRVVVTPYAVFATYRFASIWLRDANPRRWVTGLACIGGGLGWFALGLGASLEFYSPEAFGFLSFLGIPHLVLARGLLLDGLAAHVRGVEGRGNVLPPGVLLLAAGIVQPIAIVTAFAVVLFHAVLRVAAKAADLTKWLPMLVRDLAPAGLLGAAYAVMLTKDPYLQIWAQQNRLPSPPALDYALAYGLPLLAAGWGLARALRQRTFSAWLPLAWVILLPVLAYAPVSVQRRLPEGVWVAILILAASLWDRAGSQARARYLPTAVAGLALPSTVLLMVFAIRTAITPAEPAFFPTAEANAEAWLRDHAQKGSVVLSSYAVGNRLPSQAPVRVVVGHGPETAHLEELLPSVRAFYSDAGQAERNALLAEQGVQFVFWGPAERALGSWNPGAETGWIREYKEDGYEIFRLP